ncbi:ABC transporter substrate-binding protein [Alcaligenes sp. WGS1538]|uniref:ABC transporter substrate-binding protein n=1 Tax=Alcaligenes sp. WGS1538 TaxID=3366811 RepID=UPI00372D1560
MMFSASPSAQTLTVYSAGPGTLIKQLAADFERSEGVKVDVFQATTGKVMARVEAESANPRADVVISASWDSAAELDARGLLAPLEAGDADGQVPAFLKQPNYVAQGVSALGMVWNPASGAPAPQDWADLLRPEYRDRVTMPDPALSGATLDLLLGLQAARGEEFWVFLAGLKEQGMTISGPNAQALAPVLQGARAVVFGAVDYVSYAAAAKGEAVQVIFPQSGTVIAPRPIMVMKSSRQPELAQRFVRFLLSVPAQQAVGQAWLMPARTGVAAQRPLLADIRILDVQAGASERQELLQRFNQLFNRY